MARKQRQWQLLTPTQIQHFEGRFGQFATADFTCLSLEDPDYHDGPTYMLGPTDFYIVNRVQKLNHNHNKKAPLWIDRQQRAINNLSSTYRALTPLLQQFNGRLIAAGGAIAKAVVQAAYNGYQTSLTDVDIFFIGDQDPMETLIEAVAFLIEFWDAADGDENQWLNHSYVVWNANVTTVYLTGVNDNFKYQFIHRLYPTEASVLGGFDIGACMVSYDGHRISGTEMGIFAVLSQTIVVDTSRRSTSFEHRLEKYNDLFHLLLPGLNPLIKPGFIPRYSIYQVKDKIDQLLSAKGIVCIYEIFRMVENDDELNMDESLELQTEISRLAMRYGIWTDVDIMTGWFDGVLKTRRLGRIPTEIKLPYINIRVPLTALGGRRAADDREGYHRTKHIRPARRITNVEVCDYESRDYLILNVEVEPKQRDFRKSDYSHDSYCLPDRMILGHYAAVRDPARHPDHASFVAFVNPEVERSNYIQSINGVTVLSQDMIEMHGRITLPDYHRMMTKDATAMMIDIEPETLRAQLRQLFSGPHLGAFEQAYLDKRRPNVAKLVQLKASMKGVQWIIENPQRQWTSSINPIIEHPSEWYGPKNYRPFLIGTNPLIEAVLIIRKRQGTFFNLMNRDVFRMILMLIIKREAALL